MLTDAVTTYSAWVIDEPPVEITVHSRGGRIVLRPYQVTVIFDGASAVLEISGRALTQEGHLSKVRRSFKFGSTGYPIGEAPYWAQEFFKDKVLEFSQG